MIHTTKEIGDAGEAAAVKYLKRRFYKILDLQYHTKTGEIDIVAKKKNIIAFVEVRSRNDHYKISPVETVTKAKQLRIIKTASCYLKYKKIDLQPRFDIIEIIINSDKLKVISINHIINAFTQGGDYAVF